MSTLLLFFVVYTAIIFRIKGPFVGAWLIGWILFIVASLLLIMLPAAMHSSLWFVYLHSLIVLAALFLFWGTHLFLHKKLSFLWIYSTFAIIAWMIIGQNHKIPLLLYMFPGILLISLLYIAHGSIWLKSAQESIISKRLVGWTFILLGLHHLDSPFLYMNSWILPWGFIVTSSLSIIAILSTLQLYIDAQQKELRESETRYRLLADNASDLVYRYRISPEPGYEYVSPSVLHFNGYTPEELYANPKLIYKAIHPDDRHFLALLGKQLNKPKRILWLRFLHKDGHIVWTEQRYEYLYDEQGSITAIQGIIRDITERLQMEKRIEYVSVHDTLTDLYNRSFFEAKMTQFQELALIPIGIIVCDLDGLKLVNDSMGHDAGDQLLIEAAKILQTCSQPEDIVARIGGDEFAIILLNSDENRTKETADCISQAIEKFNIDKPQSFLSLSIGYTVKKDVLKPLSEALKEADYNMYQKKLFQAQSIRSTIVKTLTKTLRERDYDTEGHSERLQNLASRLARSIELPDASIEDIRLFAHFHDIGKVGIPDRILLKPGPLNHDERREMQRHSEIGFRLAQSGPELIHIADWILKHHEWWDGNGYPLGISGEAIPLECRILSIADAYDAMVSSRPYRDGRSQQAALDELNKCAGSQFDPYLVQKFVAIMESDIRTEA